MDGGCEKVMDYVNAISPNREFDRKHTHLEYFNDTIVETHWLPSVLSNPIQNKWLKRYYEDQAAQQMKNKVQLAGGLEIIAPDGEFQCVHLMLHVLGHYLYEGVGLRQLMDLYFAIRTELAQETKYAIQQRYKDFGCYGIARQVMWILQEVFGIEKELLVCEPDENGGRQLLQEIMEGGNFGHHSEENMVSGESFAGRMLRRLKRRLRLIRYNPVGTICAPWNKISFLIWKRNVIKKYKL